MYFTPYVFLESTDSSLDPLGFLQPGADLTDHLFPQFTVLSNHPAYHGFLCFALQYLAEGNYVSAERSQQELIRDMEILWGVLSLRIKNQSIINVNKYKTLPDKKLTLVEAKRHKSLYKSLNYGTLGHYTGPSMRWALLAESDRTLTTLGKNLADAWGTRGKTSFAELLALWLDGEPVLDTHSKELEPYSVLAKPSRKEQRVWGDIIEHACNQDSISAPLWENPVPAELLDYTSNKQEYAVFFPSVCEHYARSPALQQRLRLCQYFEEISALVQCVFDWAYVVKSRAEVTMQQTFTTKEQVLPALKQSIQNFEAERNGYTLRWNLPNSLQDCSSYDELENSIIQHHLDHQRRKGASAFMNRERILVAGRVNEGKIGNLVEKMDTAIKGITESATYTYRRNWYFEKCRLWLQYAGRLS